MGATMMKAMKILAVAALFSPAAVGAAPAVPLDELLAEQGLRLGAEVPSIADFQLDQRTYLDSRHLVLPAGDDRSYLVTLDGKCYGLGGNRLIVQTRTRHQLAPRDKLMVTHEGRNVDVCGVKTLHALEPR